MESNSMNMDATIQRMGALRLQDAGRGGVTSLWHATSKLNFGPEESGQRVKQAQEEPSHHHNNQHNNSNHFNNSGTGVGFCRASDDQLRLLQQQQQQQQQLLEAKTKENEQLVQEMQQMAMQVNHLETQNGLLKQQVSAMQLLHKQSQDQELVIDQLRNETSQLRMSNYRLQWMLQQFESARDAAASHAGNGGNAGGGSQNARFGFPPYPPPDIY